jgi:aldehyde:ferredoxin oxidoreductase
MITAKSPLTGKVCHAPFTLYAGLELKYSGFDYVVIKGKSPKPVYLWMHDGVADISDAKDVWGKDVWTSTDTIREVMGDQLIQVLTIGKAGESESDFAQVCINYWASGDRWGFGKLFGQKKLKGVALRGMSSVKNSFQPSRLELLQARRGLQNSQWPSEKRISKNGLPLLSTDTNLVSIHLFRPIPLSFWMKTLNS